MLNGWLQKYRFLKISLRYFKILKIIRILRRGVENLKYLKQDTFEHSESCSELWKKSWKFVRTLGTFTNDVAPPPHPSRFFFSTVCSVLSRWLKPPFPYGGTSFVDEPILRIFIYLRIFRIFRISRRNKRNLKNFNCNL